MRQTPVPETYLSPASVEGLLHAGSQGAPRQRGPQGERRGGYEVNGQNEGVSSGTEIPESKKTKIPARVWFHPFPPGSGGFQRSVVSPG